ncbi:MAG: hypothetical protein E7271_07435 [Lachnospiraceae bacterium]|jgi:UDP-N-acetyl-D-mannosaminuronic acid transferase (WecB/TagA/CpsF family)|nr:hypothetical protein [Lachnospiraceae bacterium]
MEDRIRLLGITVNTASTKDAADASIQYIQEECSKVLYFVNSETLLLLQNDNEKEKILETCDMILPGTTSVSSNVDAALGHKRDPFFLESYFDKVFDYVVENGCEVLVVADDEARFTSVQKNIHEKWPYLTLSGAFLNEKDSSDEHIVNEINSVAPELLILALDEKKQISLLKDFRSQMNADLMLFTGNILYNKAVQDAKVPDPIEKLRIQNLYKWFLKDKSGKSLFNNIKLKFRLKHDKQD